MRWQPDGTMVLTLHTNDPRYEPRRMGVMLLALYNSNPDRTAQAELAQGIVSLDLPALSRLDLYKEIAGEVSQSLAQAPWTSMLKGVLDQADFNFDRDMKRILVVIFSDFGPAMNEESMIFILEMNLQKEKFLSTLKGLGMNITPGPAGIDIVNIEKKGDNPSEPQTQKNFKLAFIDNQHVILGHETQINKVMENLMGKGNKLTAKTKLGRFLQAAPENPILSAAFTISKQLKTQQGAKAPLPFDISQVESILLTLTPVEVSMRIFNPNQQANDAMAGFVNAMIGMASAAQPQSEEERQRMEILKGIKCQALADEVKIAMPSEALFQLIKEEMTRKSITPPPVDSDEPVQTPQTEKEE